MSQNLREHSGQANSGLAGQASPAADTSLAAEGIPVLPTGSDPGELPERGSARVVTTCFRRLAAFCCRCRSASESSVKEQPHVRQAISSLDLAGVFGCLKAAWVQRAFSSPNFRQQMRHTYCRRILHCMVTTYRQNGHECRQQVMCECMH